MILRAACAPFAPVGGHDQGTEVMVWALVHGYAVLFANQPGKESPAEALPEFCQHPARFAAAKIICPRVNFPLAATIENLYISAT